MKMSEVTTLLGGLAFPESPRWRNDRLYFSDIYGSKVISVDLAGRSEVLVTMSMPSGIGWTPDGDLLVVSMDMPPQVMRVTAGAAEPEIDLSSVAVWPCNDMVIDREGTAYIGQLGMNIPPDVGVPPGAAPLVVVGDDGPRAASADALVCGNGMVITSDGKTLIVAETFTSSIVAFSIAENGSLTDRRLFAQLDDLPDGICLDEEGAIWAAVLQTGRLVRVVEGGDVTDEIVLRDDRKAVACALGGHDRKTLFLCTNSGLEEEEVMAQMDGRIETISVPVAGAGIQ